MSAPSQKASIRESANDLRSAQDGEKARQNDSGRLVAEVARALVTPAPNDRALSHPSIWDENDEACPLMPGPRQLRAPRLAKDELWR
jgi:hypothetical protein